MISLVSKEAIGLEKIGDSRSVSGIRQTGRSSSECMIRELIRYLLKYTQSSTM